MNSDVLVNEPGRASDHSTSALTVTWLRAAKFWWAQLWRGLLIMLGLEIVFVVLYGFPKMLLDEWPLLERLVRLFAVLAIGTWALVMGVRWAQGITFSDFQVSVSRTKTPTSGASSRLTGWEALRFWWALTWRAAVIGTPINLLIEHILFGTLMPTPGDLKGQLVRQAASLPIYVPLGIWATRAAFRVTYTGFKVALTPPTISGVELSPANP